MEILCGTLTPTAGEVSVSGRIAALLELGAGFNPEFSGRENVYLNAAILGIPREFVDHMNGNSFAKNFPRGFGAMFRLSQFLPDWLYYRIAGRG